MKSLVHTAAGKSGLPTMVHILASVAAVIICVSMEIGDNAPKIDVAAHDYARLQQTQARLNPQYPPVSKPETVAMQSRNQPRLVLAYLP